MIKKIVAGIVLFGVVYFLVLPWVGKFLTLVLAFGAVLALFGIIKSIKGMKTLDGKE